MRGLATLCLGLLVACNLGEGEFATDAHTQGDGIPQGADPTNQQDEHTVPIPDPPELTVRTALLQGKFDDRSGVVSLEVDGVKVDIAADGAWVFPVTLTQTEHALKLRAVDGRGNASTFDVTITANDAQGDEP